MSNDSVPTVRVKNPHEDGGYMIINEVDFVEGMELFEDEPAESDEKTEMIAQLATLNVKADRRWSVERLKAAIDDALKG